MKISPEALKIFSKASLGISKAVSPKSIGVDLTGLAGEGKDESNTPDTKPKDTTKDTTPQRELDVKAVDKYMPDEGELGYRKFSSFEDVANQYQGKEHLAPFPP